LAGKGDEILKTPQDPLADFYQVINAYSRTNNSFLKFINDPENVILGVSPQNIIDFFAWKVHRPGLNLFDRSILL
jgi:hypothetical protein